jgi:hypothetical protein
MNDQLSSFNISQTEMINLKIVADEVKTDSDKLNFIYQYLTATVQPKPSLVSTLKSYVSDTKTYLVGVPMLCAFLAAIVAFRWCYPLRVFVWGDYEEHYNKLVERRNFIWYSVIAALIIGILGNLFVFGVTTNMLSKSN